MIRKKEITFILSIIILIAITAWLYSDYLNKHHMMKLIPSFLPDSYATNVTAIRYDSNGHIASELSAPKLTHYSKDDVTVFIKPEIVLYNETQQPWKITADEGKATQGFNTIILQGNVVLFQMAGKNNPEVTIKTSLLNLDTKQQIASTKEPVVMNQKSIDGSVTSVTAIGVEAYQKTGEIKLLSHARGVYAPAN